MGLMGYKDIKFQSCKDAKIQNAENSSFSTKIDQIKHKMGV
jgi:hypothetical protein